MRFYLFLHFHQSPKVTDRLILMQTVSQNYVELMKSFQVLLHRFMCLLEIRFSSTVYQYLIDPQNLIFGYHPLLSEPKAPTLRALLLRHGSCNTELRKRLIVSPGTKGTDLLHWLSICLLYYSDLTILLKPWPISCAHDAIVGPSLNLWSSLRV